MPYNGSGTFTIINSFVPGTVILSSKVNENFDDIATNGLSEVYTLDGQAGLTAQLKAIAGTATAPGWSFTNDLTTGGYLPSAGQLGLAAAGSVIITVKNSVPSTFARGISIASNVGIVGTLAVGGATTLTGALNVTAATTTLQNVIIGGTTSMQGNVQMLAALNVSGSVNVTDVLTLNGTGASASFMKLPADTTANRPTATAARIRYNTTSSSVEWADGTSWVPASGGIVFLAAPSITGGTIPFTSVFSASYNDYMFVLDNVRPNTDDSQLILEYSVNNGSAWLGANFLSFGTGANSGGTATTTSTAAVMLSLAGGGGAGVGNDSTYGLNGICYVHNVNSALLKYSTVQTNYLASTGAATTVTTFQGTGVYNGATTAINAVRFSGGTIVAGTIKCYGIKPS